MKREIKFRAWDNANQRMVPDKELQIMTLPNFGSVPLNECLKMLGIIHKLMEYTGLKDKNGVEIFEGDILNLGMFDFDVDDGYQIFTVSDFAPDICYLNNVKIVYREIIGNIHQNPELL